jgi:hypothetical protein
MTVTRTGFIHQYVGYSWDVKPTSDVTSGSEFHELDTGLLHTFDGVAWVADATPQIFLATKTLALDGLAGTGLVGIVPLFLTTGQVEVIRIVPYCTALITEVGPGATISLGVDGNTALFIAATDIDNIDPDEFWFANTGSVLAGPIPAALKEVTVATDIQGEVAVDDLDAGEVRFDVFYRPLSAGATLVAVP